MPVLLVVDTPPYVSEGPYNAFRPGETLALRDERVDVFLMGDACTPLAPGRSRGTRTRRSSRCSSGFSSVEWVSSVVGHCLERAA